MHCLYLRYLLQQHYIILIHWRFRKLYVREKKILCVCVGAGRRVYNRGFVFILFIHMCMYACVCVYVGTCGFLVFVSSVSVSPLLTLSLSFCNAVLSALMTHISYLQLLPNPSSAGSGTDYCFQTPEERRAEQGGGWRVERDASVIQYRERSRGPAHACERAHICIYVNMSTAETSPKMFFRSKHNHYLSLLCSFIPHAHFHLLI